MKPCPCPPKSQVLLHFGIPRRTRRLKVKVTVDCGAYRARFLVELNRHRKSAHTDDMVSDGPLVRPFMNIPMMFSHQTSPVFIRMNFKAFSQSDVAIDFVFECNVPSLLILVHVTRPYLQGLGSVQQLPKCAQTQRRSQEILKQNNHFLSANVGHMGPPSVIGTVCAFDMCNGNAEFLPHKNQT